MNFTEQQQQCVVLIGGTSDLTVAVFVNDTSSYKFSSENVLFSGRERELSFTTVAEARRR